MRVAYRDIRTRLARINAYLQERITGIRVVQLFGRERERGRAVRGAQQGASRRASPVDHDLRAVLPGDRVADVGRAGDPARRRCAARRRSARSRSAPSRRSCSSCVGSISRCRISRTSSTRCSRRWRRRSGSSCCSTPSRKPRPGGRRATRRTHADQMHEHRAVTIAFEDVWFHYGESGRDPSWVLRGVSFVARPGETLALVGHTGAGKTTIVNLLLRFYEPQRGHITANGVDIRDIPLDDGAGSSATCSRTSFSSPATCARTSGSTRRSTTRRVLPRRHAWAPTGSSRGFRAARPGARRARRVGQRRRAAAALVRARHRARSRGARARRGDERRRQRDRGGDPARPRGADARTDDDRHRAPVEHDRRGRRDPRAASWRGAGARHPCGASRDGRALRPALSFAGGSYGTVARTELRYACQSLRAPGSFRPYRVPGAPTREPRVRSRRTTSDRARPPMPVLQLDDQQFPLKAGATRIGAGADADVVVPGYSAHSASKPSSTAGPTPTIRRADG